MPTIDLAPCESPLPVESASCEIFDISADESEAVNSAQNATRIAVPASQHPSNTTAFNTIIVSHTITGDVFDFEEDTGLPPRIQLPSTSRPRKLSDSSEPSSDSLSAETDLTVPSEDAVDVRMGQEDTCCGASQILARSADAELTKHEDLLEWLNSFDAIEFDTTIDDAEESSGSDVAYGNETLAGGSCGAEVETIQGGSDQNEVGSSQSDEHDQELGDEEESDFSEISSVASSESAPKDDNMSPVSTTPVAISSPSLTNLKSSKMNFSLLNLQPAKTTSWSDLMEDDMESGADPRASAYYAAMTSANGVPSPGDTELSPMDEDSEDVSHLSFSIVYDTHDALEDNVDADGDIVMTDAPQSLVFGESSRSVMLHAHGNTKFDIADVCWNEDVDGQIQNILDLSGWSVAQRDTAAHFMLGVRRAKYQEHLVQQAKNAKSDEHFASVTCDGDSTDFNIRQYAITIARYGHPAHVAKNMTLSPEEYVWATQKRGPCADFASIEILKSGEDDCYFRQDIKYSDERLEVGTTYHKFYASYDYYERDDLTTITCDTNRRFCLLRNTMMDFATYTADPNDEVDWNIATENAFELGLRFMRAPLITNPEKVEEAKNAGVSYRKGFRPHRDPRVKYWKEEMNAAYPDGRTLEAVHHSFGPSKLSQIISMSDHEENPDIFNAPAAVDTEDTDDLQHASPHHQLATDGENNDGADGLANDGVIANMLALSDELAELDAAFASDEDEFSEVDADHDHMLNDTSSDAEEWDSEVDATDSEGEKDTGHSAEALADELRSPVTPDRNGNSWPLRPVAPTPSRGMREDDDHIPETPLHEVEQESSDYGADSPSTPMSHLTEPPSQAMAIENVESPLLLADESTSEDVKHFEDVAGVKGLALKTQPGNVIETSFSGSTLSVAASFATGLDAGASIELLLDLATLLEVGTVEKPQVEEVVEVEEMNDDGDEEATCPGGWVEEDGGKVNGLKAFATEVGGLVWKHKAVVYAAAVVAVAMALW